MTKPKITSLSINCPSFEGISCPELTDGVNVIYGYNEAGKSRVKDFLEWIMFASSEEIELLKPAAAKKAFSHLNSALAGTATINIENETATITQQMVNGLTQTQVNSYTLNSKDISRELTGGLNRSHYNNIFALSLDELTHLKSNKLITEADLMNLFFGATISGAGVSPTALLKDLTNKKEEMFAEPKHAKNQKINKILNSLSELESEIKILRQEEKSYETIDTDVEELSLRLKKIDEEISNLVINISEKKQILDNYEDFSRYENLMSQDTPEINSDLIGHIIDLNMLVRSCQDLIDQGDERENQRLRTVIENIKIEQKAQFDELSETLSPDLLTAKITSPSFKSIIENEDRERIAHDASMKLIHDEIGRYSADLGLLSVEAEQLSKNIQEHNLGSKEPTDDTKNNQNNTETNSVKIKRFSLLPTLAMIAGLISAGVGFVISQPLAAAMGLIIAVTSLAITLIPSKKKDKKAEQPAITENNILLIGQLNRELENKSTKILDYQARIEKLLDEQKQVELARSKNQDQYLNALKAGGFSPDIAPNHVAMYIDAYANYLEKTNRIQEMESQIEASGIRLKSIFVSAEKMRSLGTNTPYELENRFNNLSEVHTWATSLLDFAENQKKKEEDLIEKENQIRDLEKGLISHFSDIEKTKELYTSVQIDDVQEDFMSLQEDKKLLDQQRTEIDHSIVRLTRDKEIAGTSTALSNALVREEQLKSELQALHESYCSIYVAQKVVSNALEKFLQENQPDLLRVASKMLSQITNGEWNSITVAQSENSKKAEPIIQVSGPRVPQGLSVSHLSRGTSEQLYLCLRLALMQTSIKGKQIPAIFDDIAVNSDRERFIALAPLIGEIGQQRQVLYFTCHESTRDILAQYASATVIRI